MALFDYQLGTLGSEGKLSQNDAEFQFSLQNVVIEKQLANGTTVRYKRAQMGKWQWVYTAIPGKSRDVYDGGMSRNDLFALMQADNEMSYLVPSDQGLQLAYTVRFGANTWKEKIIQRNGDYWLWQLSFELIQTR